jgi:SOS response regulatory protein OraA/RecX
MVDDAAFAATFVRDRVRFKPRAASAGSPQELRTKGGGRGDGARGDPRRLRGRRVSETELAREAAASVAEAGETATGAQTLLRFLARRGFGGDASAR